MCRSKVRRAITTLLLAGFCAFTCIVPGCGPSGATEQAAMPTDRFIPSPERATYALRAAFDAWRGGESPGMVADTSPAVHVTDTYRRPGEQLVDYRILGEVPSERPRCYAVELTFEPKRTERVRFLVVGIDPLWVFRQEDAENLSHWEHNMSSPGDHTSLQPPPADAGGDGVATSETPPASTPAPVTTESGSTP